MPGFANILWKQNEHKEPHHKVIVITTDWISSYYTVLLPLQGYRAQSVSKSRLESSISHYALNLYLSYFRNNKEFLVCPVQKVIYIECWTRRLDTLKNVLWKAIGMLQME